MAESHQKMKLFKIPIIHTKMESQYCYKTEFRAFEASAVEKTHAMITMTSCKPVANRYTAWGVHRCCSSATTKYQ